VSAAAEDVRVQEARRRIAALPHDTELVGLGQAELVAWVARMHGAAQLLDAYVRDATGIEPGGSATLMPADITRVLGALADAEAFRRKRAEAWCAGCETSAAGACSDHLDDLDAADAYRDLAAKLGKENNR
jgi:hypothetical protein